MVEPDLGDKTYLYGLKSYFPDPLQYAWGYLVHRTVG